MEITDNKFREYKVNSTNTFYNVNIEAKKDKNEEKKEAILNQKIVSTVKTFLAISTIVNTSVIEVEKTVSSIVNYVVVSSNTDVQRDVRYNETDINTLVKEFTSSDNKNTNSSTKSNSSMNVSIDIKENKYDEEDTIMEQYVAKQKTIMKNYSIIAIVLVIASVVFLSAINVEPVFVLFAVVSFLSIPIYFYLIKKFYKKIGGS